MKSDQEFYEMYGFSTTDLIPPYEDKKVGIVEVVNHIRKEIAAGRPLTGDYKDFIVAALDKIARGIRPDAAFLFRLIESGQVKTENELKHIEAMKEIYRRVRPRKITSTIQEVAEEFGISYESLRRKWYVEKWQDILDDYYEEQNKLLSSENPCNGS